MFEWNIVTRDERLAEIIENCKITFDYWFDCYWSKQVTRAVMLSEKSPVPHVYYKMTKSFDEVKALLPHEGTRTCSCCDNECLEWIETSFSFCNEYDCGMVLCKTCATKLKNKIIEFESEET